MELSYIFSKESFSYISGSGNPKKLFVFRKWNFQSSKKKKKKKKKIIIIKKKKKKNNNNNNKKKKKIHPQKISSGNLSENRTLKLHG